MHQFPTSALLTKSELTTLALSQNSNTVIMLISCCLPLVLFLDGITWIRARAAFHFLWLLVQIPPLLRFSLVTDLNVLALLTSILYPFSLLYFSS